MEAFLAAFIGFAVAATLAVINSWLAGREKVAEGVREERLKTYPAVWERTAVVSRWPRTDASRPHCRRLHDDLRRWYYSSGGLFMSAHARKRYEHLQLVLEAIAAQDDGEPFTDYDVVMEAASYFRTGLTADLESRNQRNPIVAIRTRAEERGARSKAARREELVGVPTLAKRQNQAPAESTIHTLTAAEETLHLPAP